MGLFGSKRVTYIESSSQRLMEETPNLVRDSVTASILNNRDIPSDILASYTDSLHNKGKQVRRYAKNSYPYGLPNGTVNYVYVRDDLVRIVLKNLYGPNVEIISNVLEPANAARFVIPFLETERGYDIDTDIISNPPFTPNGAITPVTFVEGRFISDTQVEVVYSYDRMNGSAVVTEEPTETITISSVDVKAVYYHVTYYPINERREIVGPRSYWFYNPATGVHSTLDVPNVLEETSQYYPIIPIRENKVNLTAESRRDTALYKASRRLLKFWDIKIEELGESVHASPDINDVDHAYVMVGVDIQDTAQPVLVYLHEYFNYLYDRSQVTLDDFIYWKNHQRASPPPINTVTIKDANYRMDLNYTYITRTEVIGSVGKIGHVTRTYDVGTRVTSGNKRYSYETSTFTLRRQVTVNMYVEILVHGLYHVNYVYPTNTVSTSLADALTDPEDKNNFIVPVNIEVADNISRLHSNSLMYYGIRIVFNSKITKKLKWYETSFFNFFIKVVAIAIAIYGGWQFSQALIAAASAGATQVALVVVQAVLVTVSVNIAMDFLVDFIGLEGTLVAALVATAVAFATNNPKITGIGEYQLPSAIDMLQITKAMIEGYQVQLTDALEDVHNEMEAFNAYAQELVDALELSDTSNNALDPFTLNLIDTSMGAYETPEEFITRTTYNDNIGVLSLEAPAIFADRLLELDIPSNEIRTQI